MGIFGFGSKEAVYFPGCYSSAFLQGKISNYKRIMKKLGIDFSMVDEQDINCCGGLLIESGYDKEARKLAKDNFDFLKKKGTKKIITNCPLCYVSFNEGYKRFLFEWNIKSKFILAPILEKLKQRENLDIIKNFTGEKIIYYDSCCLGRSLKIHEAPREILRMIGYNIVEMPYSKEESLCCGSCGGLPLTNKELSQNIAKNFLKKVKSMKIGKIVTSDPQAYFHLKEAMKLLNMENLFMLEFSDVLCDAMDIGREDD